MNLDDYKDFFLDGKKNEIPTGICGRILRGKSPEDFETLTDDPIRTNTAILKKPSINKNLL